MGKLTEGMQIVTICELFGWDYYTFKKQPSWFVDLIKDKLDVDGKKAKQQMGKIKK